MATNNLSGSLGLVENLSDLSSTPMDCIPAGHFSLAEYSVPLSAAELLDFGPTINPLNTTNSSSREGRTSTLIQPMTFPDWYLMMSVGVVVVPDAKAFAINGASVAAPAASSTVPQFDGTIPATGLLSNGGELDTTARYGQLSWGHCTMQAAWSFLHAYRMQMILTGKFLLFDELCAHIGACVSAEEWTGTGNPNIDVSRYIRSVNDRQALLNSPTTGTRFIPQTIIAGDTPVGAPPPLAPVGYFGPKMDGIFGGWYPTRGLLMYPGMPFQNFFIRQDNEHLYYDRMASNLGIEAEITWDKNFTDVVTPSAGPAARGFSSAVPFKGGLFKLGVLYRGCSLAPKPCVDWYRMSGHIYNPDAARALYQGAMGYLQTAASNGGYTNGIGDVTDGPSSYTLPGPQGLDPSGIAEKRPRGRGRHPRPGLLDRGVSGRGRFRRLSHSVSSGTHHGTRHRQDRHPQPAGRLLPGEG